MVWKNHDSFESVKKSIIPSNPDEREQNLRLVDIKPSLLLEGDNPRLLDEWQDAPQLWDSVRSDVDKRGETGLYILTGSTAVDGDHSRQEVDAVLHLKNGKWGAIEVKSGDKAVDQGAESLKKLADKIDKDFMNVPSFLAVITAGGYAYKREDGVYVIPIGCLRN